MVDEIVESVDQHGSRLDGRMILEPPPGVRAKGRRAGIGPDVRAPAAFGYFILWPGRRQILWLGVTAHPSAEWMGRQLTEAYEGERMPEYLVRDRDRVYGEVFTRRLRAMGIRDRPKNGHAERLIGSLRRECLDHVVVFGERHLRHMLLLSMDYYNKARTHLSLNKDAPVPRAI